MLAVIAVGATVFMIPNIQAAASLFSSASIVQGLKSDIAIFHIDVEDSAVHFSASETFAKQGDRDLRRSDEAMRDKDLELALHLARDSTRAYDKGRVHRRLVVAEKFEHQLAAARQDAHRSRISKVFTPEEVNAAAEAEAEADAHLSFKVSSAREAKATGRAKTAAKVAVVYYSR